MSVQHTPGPWEVDCSGLGAWIMAGGPTGVHVATIPIARDGDWSEANARLIAAAPDMLSALRGVVAAWDRNYPLLPVSEAVEDDEFGAARIARAAIAKAEGK